MVDYDASLFVNRERELRGFGKMLRPETPQAIMLIHAGEHLGKSWLIGEMFRHCKEKSGELPVAIIDFGNPREREEITDTLGLVRLVRTKLGYPDHFRHLNQVINSFTQPEMDASVSAMHALAVRMEQRFDLRSLERLSQFLGVNYESLPGDVPYRKAYSLVDHFRQRDTLDTLISRLEEERPGYDWRQGLEPLLGERKSLPDADVGTSEPMAVDHNAPLAADSVKGRSLAERRINEAFFSCLQELTIRVQPIVFLFDGCERVPDEAKQWIREQLLDRLRAKELEHIVIIFAGRTTPDLSDLGIDDLTVQTSLDGFDEKDVLEFFKRHKVPMDPLKLPVYVEASGGKPGVLALMADNLRAQTEKHDSFFDD